MISQHRWLTRLFGALVCFMLGMFLGTSLAKIQEEEPTSILNTTNLPRFDLTLVAGFGWTNITAWDHYTGQAWALDKVTMNWIALPPLPKDEVMK